MELDTEGPSYTTRHLLIAGLLLAAALLASCVTHREDEAEVCLPSDCAANEVCQDGECVLDTTGSGGCSPACRVGYTCRNGVCKAKGGSQPSSGDVGASCTSAGDCSTDVCLTDSSIPGGYCSKRCSGQVTSSGPTCPSSATCVQFDNGNALCLDACGSNADCRNDYICASVGGGAVCLPRCQTNQDCSPGQVCNTQKGLCEDRAQSGQIGAACTQNSDCNSNACLTEQDTDGLFPGGSCVNNCSASQQGQTCQNGEGLCLGFDGNGGDTVYVCMQNCTTGNACRSGYYCSADEGISNNQGYGVCYPTCENYQCEAGKTCNRQRGVCVDQNGGGSGGPVDVQVNHVWDGRTGNRDDLVRKMTFQVPDNAVSFTLVADPASLQNTPVLVKLNAPNGETIYNANSPVNSKASLLPATGVGLGPYATLYPNSPQLNIPAGTYTVWFGAASPGDMSVEVLTKTGDVYSHEHKLPVTFWFLPQNHLSASQAPNDRDFQQAVSRMKSIYSNAGIEVGPISYQSVTGSRARDLAVVDGSAEFAALFDLLDPSKSKGLNFVMVDQFNLGTGGGQTLGYSNGIPGPPGVAGTNNVPTSGVAVALAFLDGQSTQFASTLAHEGGHHMGLFHTTERAGQSFDPLPDTAECSARNDNNGNGTVDAEECIGNGARNLMFWVAGHNITQEQITQDQIFVLERNPALK